MIQYQRLYLIRNTAREAGLTRQEETSMIYSDICNSPLKYLKDVCRGMDINTVAKIAVIVIAAEGIIRVFKDS